MVKIGQGTNKSWRYPLAHKFPIVRFHTPSSSHHELDTRNLQVEGRCDHTSLVLPGTCAWLLPGVNLQPAPVHRRPAENLPLALHFRDRKQIFGQTGNPTFGTPPSRGTLKPNRVRPRTIQAVTGGPLHRPRGHQYHLNYDHHA